MSRPSPVLVAADYRACATCGALRGDPCRTPLGRVAREVHAGRAKVAPPPAPPAGGPRGD